jgi:hypothetical protein
MKNEKIFKFIIIIKLLNEIQSFIKNLFLNNLIDYYPNFKKESLNLEQIKRLFNKN